MEILKFYTEWCHSCSEQTEEFKNNPLDINVKSIDAEDEDNTALVDKYNVSNLPTIVLVDYYGNVLHKWVGFTKVEEINKFIKEL